MAIKSKFLFALISLLGITLALASFFSYQTFSEDKKLFVMDLNLAVLRAIVAETRAELRPRLDAITRTVNKFATSPVEPPATELFRESTLFLEDEVIGITLYRRTQGTWTAIREFRSKTIATKKRVPEDLLAQVNLRHKIPPQAFGRSMTIVNRSIPATGTNGGDVAILGFIVGGLRDSTNQEAMAVVDTLQDTLRKTLQQSPLAEVFLVRNDGALLSHSSLKETVQYAGGSMNHPVLSMMKERPTNIARESSETDIEGEAWFVNLADTGVEGVLAVSQMKKSEAFVALRVLFERCALILLIVFSASMVVSILLATRLSADVKKIKIASEMLANGYQDVSLEVQSTDELGQIAQHVRSLATQIRDLKRSSAPDNRAQPKHATVLAGPQINHPAVELAISFSSGSRSHGDFWDARAASGYATLLIGNASGDGGVAPLATAATRACFGALSSGDAPPTPEAILAAMNRTLYDLCQGKMTVSACIAQVNLHTGDVRVAAGGTKGPLLWRAGAMNLTNRSADSDRGEGSIAGVDGVPGAEPVMVLAPAGESLGTRRETRFAAVTGKMTLDDALLFYTAGVTTLHSTGGQAFGEGALRDALHGDSPGDAAGIRDRLEDTLSRHRGEAEQEDDRTMVVLVWKTRVPATAVAGRTVKAKAAPPVPEKPPAEVAPAEGGEKPQLEEEEANRERLLTLLDLDKAA